MQVRFLILTRLNHGVTPYRASTPAGGQARSTTVRCHRALLCLPSLNYVLLCLLLLNCTLLSLLLLDCVLLRALLLDRTLLSLLLLD
jgi:hypothetical protein